MTVSLLLRVMTFAAAVIALDDLPAHAEGQWHLRDGALSCQSYSEVNASEAASRRGDASWLAQTGCAPIYGRPEVVIVEPTPLPGGRTGIWRVRLIPSNGDGFYAYVRAFNIMGLPMDPHLRSKGPVPYHEAYETSPVTMENMRRDAEAQILKQRRQFYERVCLGKKLEPSSNDDLLCRAYARVPPGPDGPSSFDALLRNLSNEQPR